MAPGFDAATQTCAGTQNIAGACTGDSGGPLLIFDRATGAPALWGLTSYGPQIGLGLPICSLQAPAVFTWVPAFSSWISQTVATPAPPPSPSAPGAGGPATERHGRARAEPRAARQEPHPRRPPHDALLPALRGGRRDRHVLRKTGSRLKPILRVPFGAPAGTVRRGFAARLRSKPLRRGRYVLRLAAVDTAGNRSKTASVPFRVVR